MLDILLAYASLIYPPPGSHHKPVSAKTIVIAGNSAGANLGLALTRVLLEFSRETGQQGPKILFHGQCVQLHLPAGVAVFSGWCDQCDVLPSWYEKGEHDILVQVQPALMPEYPADEIWPSNPPREHPYCAGSTLDHELVSPVAVGDWSGAPPMWFACGTEDRCLDGNRMIASQAARCGVPVLWNEYEGMPHEFAVLLGKLPQSKHCFASCATACKAFGEGKPISSRSLRMKMPACEDIDLGDVAALAPLPLNEVKRRMRERTRHIPVWTGTRSLKSRI